MFSVTCSGVAVRPVPIAHTGSYASTTFSQSLTFSAPQHKNTTQHNSHPGVQHDGVSMTTLNLMFTCDQLGLSVQHLLRGPALSLLQLLPDAGDHTQAALQSVSHLRTRNMSSSPSSTFRPHRGRLTFCPISSSPSPNTWRRSECPRTTQSAPQSFIMSGLPAGGDTQDTVGFAYLNLKTNCTYINFLSDEAS